MSALPVVDEQRAPSRGEDLVHDFSSLSTAASCLRKFKHKYVDRLDTPGPNPAMHAGSALHAAFEVLYGERWDLGAALDALAEAWAGFRTPPNHKHSYLSLGHLEIVLENYVDDRERSPTILEKATVVGSGVEGATVFEWPDAEGEILRVGGVPDIAIEVAGQRYIVDHKATTSWLNDWWAKGFSMSHQFKIYCAMMQHVYGLRFDGAYVNGVYMGEAAADEDRDWSQQKSSPNRLFGPFNYTGGHLAETREWVRRWSEIIERCEEDGEWPQNERACGDYGGCSFLPLCELPPAAREAKAASAFERWEPTGVLVSGADSD